MIGNQPELASLFRVVQEAELLDLANTMRFATTEGSLEGKFFWTTVEDAERFERLLLRTGIGPSWTVEVAIAESALERLQRHHTDGRPARFVEEDDLDWFNKAVVRLVVPDREMN
jgi:hypothetical protein